MNLAKTHIKNFKSCSKNCKRFFCNKTNVDNPFKKSIEEVLRESSPLKNNIETGEFATSGYPDGTVFSRYSQAERTLRPKCDPRGTSIILFPGQGTQFVGMAKDLIKYPIAKDMFDAASQILGYDLYKLCNEGPLSKLSKTEYCQPAVLVCSLAAIEKLKDIEPQAINNCIATAGFSVGEISALVFAGCFSFERAIKLVKIRGEAMKLCSEMIPSGMITVLFGADAKLSDALKHAKEFCVNNKIENPVCEIANYLYPGCKVLAGHNKALQFISENAEKYKIRRVSRLPVSGAFHTPLMKPASDAIYQVLRKTPLNDPIVTVHSNVKGILYRNAQQILSILPKQVYFPVKWEQLMHILYERPEDEYFPHTYECGPGWSLKTILKRVNLKAAVQCHNVMQLESYQDE